MSESIGANIAAPQEVAAGEQRLRAGALGLPSVVMQGLTHIAPAVGVVLTIQFITTLAGVAAPFAFLVAVAIVFTLGVSLTQLARAFPSAGGYYTYVSRTVSPRTGWLTSWLYLLYDPINPAFNLAFMGFFFESTMKHEYGFDFPWWWFLILGSAFLWVIAYLGIELSARTMITLGVAEIAVCLVLAAWGLFDPGPGGVNLSPWNPANAPSFNGLYLAVVFSIFSFTGFESVAPLAEETRSPRRNLPRGIIGSILIMGVFFLFSTWALLVGWGTDDIHSFATSAQNPIFVLAQRFWGGAWIIVMLAVINSILAVSIAANNACTRVYFAMARSGAMPQALGRLHPRYRTPVNAIHLQTLVTLVVGLGVGFWIGPDQEFFLFGTVIVLGLIFVYGAGNLGVWLHYRREGSAEFNWLLHFALPLVSTAALVWVGWKSIHPLPPSPIKYAPWIVGLWLLGGLLVLAGMKIGEGWVPRAGDIADEPASADEKGADLSARV